MSEIYDIVIGMKRVPKLSKIFVKVLIIQLFLKEFLNGRNREFKSSEFVYSFDFITLMATLNYEQRLLYQP